MSKRPYISTGHAAKLLGVTPDTVLKWIKRGRLVALRTAGGHFRIPREQIDSLVEALSSSASQAQKSPPQHCWEHFAADGSVAPECRSCLVHRSRADHCWELMRYPKEAGFTACFHVKTTCDACEYFRERQHAPVRLLIVTDSAELRRRVSAGVEAQSRFRVEFASHGYDCSLQVERFRPELVVIDGSLAVDECAALCTHLANDVRIPGVKIVLAATRAGKVMERAPGVVGEVGSGFELRDLLAWVGPGTGGE